MVMNRYQILLVLLGILLPAAIIPSASAMGNRELGCEDVSSILFYLLGMANRQQEVDEEELLEKFPCLAVSTGNSGPEPTTELEEVGNGSVSNPLRVCQGDCDNNDECAGHLECFLRGEKGVPPDEPVPGCITGNARDFVDFCYDPDWGITSSPSASPSKSPSESPSDAPSDGPSGAPSDVPSLSPSALLSVSPSSSPSISPSESPVEAPPEIPSGDFRLRLWWKLGYTWQENPKEQWFCLRCDSGRTCEAGDKVKIYDVCDESSTSFEFLEVQGSGGMEIMLKDHRSNNCLRYEEVRDVGPNQRGYNAVYMRMQKCDDDDERQRWETKGNGQFWENHFELWSVLEGDSCDNYVRDGCDDRCVTMMHHPRRTEEIWSENCWLARRDASSFWEPHYY